MEDMVDVQDGLQKARRYVLEGGKQILAGQLDEAHGVSVSPGATALASLALLALGSGFENANRQGVQWLWHHRQNQGWGRFPHDQPDAEITKIVQTVIQGSQGGWLAKIRLLMEARQFSRMILSLGQRVVPGLEGPTPEEIQLPNILRENVLGKLPLYGRPVVIAASLLASHDNQAGVREGIEYLRRMQMPDGSWSEDIVATSMGLLALQRYRSNADVTKKAGKWLVQKQYSSGGWPAFDQLHTWAIGWAVGILAETNRTFEEEKWLKQAVKWLRQGQNSDGSYGSTPPYTHPDLDDTAVALIGLHQLSGEQNKTSVQLLKRLQNTDGSWGTFPSFRGVPPEIECELPVYIPSVDVTVHVIEALWRQNSRVQDQAIFRGLNWLLQQQNAHGEFASIWFESSIYSTAQVLELLSKWKFNWEQWKAARQIYLARKKALEFILPEQIETGNWGNTVVDTALVLSALWRFPGKVPRDVSAKGIRWLLAKQKRDGSFEPSYRGIYAKGWNYEEPLSTALTAIRAFERYRFLKLE